MTTFAAVLDRLSKLENPYPGLRPFQTSEAHLFFGRDKQTADLIERLERTRLVAVVGVSGSGKSSLVRAGLIPALQRGGAWDAGTRCRVVTTNPGGSPYRSLASDLEKAGLYGASLKRSSFGLIEAVRPLATDESLLLVVDQFEELFRYKDAPTATESAKRHREQAAIDASAFVQLLLAASRHQPPIYIVLTMRSDYLGDCAEFRDLPETLNDCQYLVPRLTREERKEAIEGPLAQTRVSPDLVQRVLNDAGDEPDQLPVLQHALMRTWAHWNKRSTGTESPIELRDYEAIGGFAGALDRHAEELLAHATIAADRTIVETIFRRLTARGTNHRERRDPARLSELWAICGAGNDETRAKVNAVIDVFRSGDATFLNPREGRINPDDFVDISHESLIRQWKTLRDQWEPKERRSARTFLRLVERAKDWKEGRGELLVGLDLMEALNWNQQRNRSVAWANHYADVSALEIVTEFIASSEARERQLVELKQQEVVAQQKLREERSNFILEQNKAIARQRGRNLDERGWGVIFAETAPEDTREAIRRLLEHRRQQAGARFHEFVCKPGEPAERLIGRLRKVLGTGEDLPFYLLLVGDAEQIPFTVQYELAMQYAVGRLYFETAAEYQTYADSVIQAETQSVAGPRRALVFSPRHNLDTAMAMLHSRLLAPMISSFSAQLQQVNPHNWSIELIPPEQATKARLLQVLENLSSRLLFTAAHGVAFPNTDLSQKEKQGSVLCGDWEGPGTPLKPEMYLTASEVPHHANLTGAIMLAFGEYTAGTPKGDDFGRATALADQAMISRLPMRLLGNPAGGLLAFVGHVDMTWAFSFLAADGTPSIEAFSGFISTLMNGGTVGLAMQSFRMRAARLIAATLDFFSLDPNSPNPAPTQLVKNRLIAAKDMRNYIVLGDPAVALNLEMPQMESPSAQ